MTVSSEIDSVQYTLPSILVPLPVTFRFLEEADLRVVHAPVSGTTPVELTLNTDYTVTGARTQGGGTVTLLIATNAGDTVSIDRGNMARTQLIDYRANDPFPEEDAEDGLDRLTMLLQQAGIDGGRRSLTLFPTDPPTGGRYDANNNRIAGMADGVDPTDAATLQQVISAGSGNFIQAGAGAIIRTMQDKARDWVAVTDFGAAGDGVTDDTLAVQNAILYAIASGRTTLYFPGGKTYYFASASPSLDPGVGSLTICGDGRDSSIILFDEGTAVGSILDRKNLFRNTDNVTKGALTFRDLQFLGTWSNAGYPSGQGGATMLLDYYDEIVIQSCKFTNLRSYVMANEFIRNARVIDCTFDKNARDNVRFRSTFNAQVIGNRFSHCDDDAVALHSNINVTGGNIREGIVVSGNIFEDTPAIQIIGGRVVTVTNNVLRRCKQNGILVYTATGVANEGDNAIFSVDVSNNQIYDMLADSPFSAPVTQVIGVYARAARGGTSTGSVVPGQPLTATGVFVLPWNNRNTAYNVAADSIAPPYFVRIQNNTIARTLPAVGAYTTYGYGPVYAGDGPQDPAVTDTALRPGAGILLGGQVRKAIVSGNVISHVTSCLSFDQEAGSNFGLDDVLVTDNVMFDFASNGVSIPNPGSVRYINLDIRHNLFDGDPYCISSNRKTAGTTDGTWLADAAPQVISCVSHNGVRLEQNKIRNVGRIVNNSGGSIIALKDNVLRCDPTTTGFSTSNKGIGNCPRADDAYRYEIMDSDPTSATYGQMSQSLLPYSAAQPASGKYVAGTFIRASSGTTLLGWQRLTTGTAHVAGTDWKTVVLT